MQISQRELTLQKIIKNQEARIQELEKHVANPSLSNTDRLLLRQKERQLEEIIADLRERLRQKQKQNTFMKQELIIIRGQIKGGKESQRNLQQMSKQRDTFLRSTTQMEGKVKQLQFKLNNATTYNQKVIQKLQRQNKTLTRQNNAYKQNMISIQLQIQKLQIFYRSSIQQLPKRKQTLTWVSNLVKFIDKYQHFLKQHPLQKQCQYLQKPLNSLESIVKQSSEEIRANLNDRVAEMRKLKQQILNLIGDTQKKYHKILEQNKVFWDDIKKQKTQRSGQTERKLDEEYKKLKQQYESKHTQLLKQFKLVDQQKREIVLAIQQLKGYYQSRQKNYKQQISLLKKTQLKMIDFSQKREAIFEQQILRLSSQVTYLGQLYEESLKSNIKNHNDFISNEIRAAKQIMSPAIKNELKQIISLLRDKQTNLEKQMSSLSEHQLKGLQLVKNSCDTLLMLQNRFSQCLQLLKQQTNDEQQQIQDINIEVARFQQLEDRKNYQINLIKKRNDRLQQQILKLQDKIKHQTNPKDNQLIRSLKQKNQQLQDQNILLEQSNQILKKKFNTTLKRLAKVSSSGIKQLFFDNIQMISVEIQKIQSTQYQQLLPLIKTQTIKQQEYAEIIQANLKQILKVMEQPFQYLNSLIKTEQQQKVVDGSGRVIKVSVNFAEQIRQYKQILEDRVATAPITKINKVLTDLIFNIKQTLPQRDNNRGSIKEVENIVDRKTVKIKTPIEQRIRDVQNNRIADKNQMAKILQKVQISLKKVDGGRLAMTKSTQILSRIETSLGKMTKQIGDMLQKSLIERQFKQLTGLSKNAISDLQAKLKESVFQNQGLTRQFKLVSNLQAMKQLRSEKKQ